MLVTGAVCQYVLTFTGVRIPLVTGLVLVSGGLFCYTRRTPDASYAAGMLPGLLLTAAGAGLAWQLLFLVATAKVRPEESGLASGLVNSAQQIGAAIGLAALAVVAAARTSHVLAQIGGKPTASQAAQALTLGFQRGFVIAGIIVAVAAVVALLGVRAGDIQHGPEPELTAVVDAAADAEFAGEAVVSVEP
jgi:hypothetical protein